MPTQRTRLVAAFATVYVIWGSTFLAIRFAIETIPPLLMAASRFLIAGTLLYAWLRARGTPRPRLTHWRNTALLGTLLLAGGNGAVVWAERTVPSGVTALLVATVPLWMVLLDWLRPGGTRPPGMVGAGIVVGFAGMLVLSGIGAAQPQDSIHLTGVVVIVLGSLSWAAGSLLATSLPLPSQLMATAMEMLAGGTVLFFAGTIHGELALLHPASITPLSIAALGYLVVFGSLIAFSAYTWLLDHATPAAVGTYAYVNPVVAMLLGWTAGHERITPRMLAGATIILTAVVIITTARTSRRRESRSRSSRRAA